ncbi:NAD(+) kinase [Aliidiomarina shirensis]|uniref:NAD kinase n=1 Tax=Aliidiomarina shirensis TaxID=1048642 RepID=A0A432WYD1_9GAMM|nr:NAD(+) kinase [Aliidiomarina shirensis]RUO38756.1 NAD(+) kinase [Aliidiomarina shirensis]
MSEPKAPVNPPFRIIGLLCKKDSETALETLEQIARMLVSSGYQVLADSAGPEAELPPQVTSASLAEIGEQAELAIVIGGDGKMLGAARKLSLHNIAVIGVNRGNLGFLTDLAPDEASEKLLDVLAGNYNVEHRFLLDATIELNGETLHRANAMNEVVLHSDQVAHMLEFEVEVDGQFVFSQRSDGLIIATPTGSTAYSLSAGGPILYPGLNAITLVPMFPHTLSSRPIVVGGDSVIRVRVAPDDQPLHISCDGHVKLPVPTAAEIYITRQQQALRLIHPKGYNYYHVLRNKLNWGSRLF